MGALGILLFGLLGGAIALDGAADLWRASATLAVAGLAAIAAWQRGLRPARPEALSVVALWSALAGFQLLWAHAFDAALDAAAALLTAGAVFLIAGTALPRRAHRQGLVLFGLLGALVAVAAIVAAEPGAPASAPFGNPNRLAAWLLLPAALAFVGIGARAPEAHRMRRSLLWIGVLALCVAALARTDSLGGGLAFGAAAAAVIWLARAPRRVGLAAVVAALGIVALGLVFLPALAPDWVPAARKGSEFSPGIRWHIYAAAGRSALGAAPLGTGLGGFAAAFTAERPSSLPYAPRHAHSEPLQALVELGLPFVLVLALSLFLALRRRRWQAGSRSSLAGSSALAAGVAVASHALVDAPLRVPAVALGLAVILGLAWAGEEAAGKRSVRTTRLALVALALSLSWLGGSGAVASLAERSGRDALEQGRFARAAERARWGLAARSADVALWRLAAEAAEHEARLGDGGPAALARAVSSRRRAVDASPRSATLRIELARSLERVGDASASLAELAVAGRLDPASPAPHLARARVLLEQGRTRDAADAAREALLRHPLATRPVVAELLRLTGEPELALSAVPVEPAALARAARELDRAGYRAAAASAMEESLRLEPGNVRVALESAQFWRIAGHPRRAASVLSRALAQSPEDTRLRRALERTMALGGGGDS